MGISIKPTFTPEEYIDQISIDGYWIPVTLTGKYGLTDVERATIKDHYLGSLVTRMEVSSSAIKVFWVLGMCHWDLWDRTTMTKTASKTYRVR